MNSLLTYAAKRWKVLAPLTIACTCIVSGLVARSVVQQIRRQEIAQNVLFSRGCFYSTYLSLGKTSPAIPRFVSAVFPARWIPANHMIYESYCEGRTSSEFKSIMNSMPNGVSIRMISFDGSALDDRDIEHFLDKCDREVLEELWLRKCRLLSDRAVENLSSCPKLLRVGLSGTSITDHSLEILSSMTVSAVSVDNTNATCEGVAQFRKRTPAASIDSDRCDR